MRVYSVAIFVLILTTGCSSEVDKCVDSYLRVYDTEWSADSKKQRSRADFEANMRYLCLKAANKND